MFVKFLYIKHFMYEDKLMIQQQYIPIQQFGMKMKNNYFPHRNVGDFFCSYQDSSHPSAGLQTGEICLAVLHMLGFP